MAEIHEIATQVISDHLGSKVDIVGVHVEGGVDSDGEQILSIRVIFESGGLPLDARKTSSMIRRLRPKLAEAGEDRFPMISYFPARHYKGEDTRRIFDDGLDHAITRFGEICARPSRTSKK